MVGHHGLGLGAAHRLGDDDEQLGPFVVGLPVPGLEQVHDLRPGQRREVQRGQRGGQPGPDRGVLQRRHRIGDRITQCLPRHDINLSMLWDKCSTRHADVSHEAQKIKPNSINPQ